MAYTGRMGSPAPDNREQEIARHYSHGSLVKTIFDAMKAAGVDPERASADDFSAFDEFHSGGRAATADLAAEMDVAPGMRLLDIGSGIGGPARYFAAHRGCLVTGIDLSGEFCDAAKAISSRTGLADRTEFRQVSAQALPFDDAMFDAAYLLHVGMNIPRKAEVFREVARVLRPGAVFGIFDVMRDGGGELMFPLPWASSAEMSFVESAEDYGEYLRAAGFEVEKQRSRRDFALTAFSKMRAAVEAAVAAGAPPPPGPQILMGPSAPVKVGNLVWMMQGGVLAPVEIVSRKR